MPREFQLLIKPASADCNAACEYCFYTRVNTEGMYPAAPVHRMSLDVLERMTHELLSYRFRNTVFSWQGGEPTLMGLEFFQHAVRLQEQHGLPGQAVGNALQTNGILIDDDWARFLARYRFLVGLSLDGPEDVHDTYRKTKSGSGTWQQVMRAVDRCRTHGVNFNILTVVNDVNQHRARDVYHWMVDEQGFDYLQFIPCIELDPSTGAIARFSASPAGYGQFLCDLFDEWYESGGYRTVSIRTFDSVLNYYVTGRSTMCIFGPTCDVYLVVEHTGDIYPCDFFVRPELHLGNLMDQPLERFFDHPIHEKFARAKVRNVHPECRTCEWWDLCHAGCQKDRIAADGYEPTRTYFCESYKRLFAHAHTRFKVLADEVRRRRAAYAVPPGAKIGRNDPCPCGSGRKYKHCCMPR